MDKKSFYPPEFVDALVAYDQLRKRGFFDRTAQALLEFAAFIDIAFIDPGSAAMAATSSRIPQTHPLMTQLNNIVSGPNLHALMYRVYEINMWGVPGAPYMGSPTGRLLATCFPGFGEALTYIEQMMCLSQQKDAVVRNGKLIISGIPNITVFISQRLMEIMSIDETIALFLHEVGENTRVRHMLIYKSTTRLIQMAAISKFLITSMGPAYLVFLVVALNLGMIGAKYGREAFADADRIATMCGYGDPLRVAIRKQHAYTLGSAGIRTSGFNIVEQIHNVLDYSAGLILDALNRIFKLDDDIRYWQRDELVEKAMKEGIQKIRPKPMPQTAIAALNSSPKIEDQFEQADMILAWVLKRMMKQLRPIIAP